MKPRTDWKIGFAYGVTLDKQLSSVVSIISSVNFLAALHVTGTVSWVSCVTPLVEFSSVFVECSLEDKCTVLDENPDTIPIQPSFKAIYNAFLAICLHGM